MRYALAIILSLFIHSVKAQEVEIGAGLVCDSAAQVSRFLEIGGEPEQALSKVNEEAADPTACILTGVAFIRGEQGEPVRNKDGAWRVTQILVVAVYLPTGWQQIAPHIYYSALRVEEERGA